MPGFGLDPSVLPDPQPIPGPHSDRIAAIARANGLYICCGLVERDGEHIYNTAILLDDQGRILLKYRKINVLDVAFDMYSIGTHLSVVDTKFSRIGVNICSDNYGDSLDIGSVLGRMGARLILSPSSGTVEYSVTEQCGSLRRQMAGTIPDFGRVVRYGHRQRHFRRHHCRRPLRGQEDGGMLTGRQQGRRIVQWRLQRICQ